MTAFDMSGLVSAEAPAAVLARLVDVGIALAAEPDHDRLMGRILDEAMDLTHAEGGTVYLVSDDESRLDFRILRNRRLNLSLDDGGKLPPLPLFATDGEPNRCHVAAAAYHNRAPVLVDDAYTALGYDFSGTRAFDARTGYRSRSFLTLPLTSRSGHVIGVLQLLNAISAEGEPVPFPAAILPLVQALASQAAVALENRLLIEQQRALWDALIELLARAIDDKSPYTGGHCQRVPVLTKALARAACDARMGEFADFSLDDTEWYELHVAAWLHDCGKITTPEYVVDKATKLETLYNRIHEIRTRFEVLRRDAEIDYLRARLDGEDEASARSRFDNRCAELADDFAFVARTNVGAEHLADDAERRLRTIGAQRWFRSFDKSAGLGPQEPMPAQPGPGWEPLLADLPEHHRGSLNHGELHNMSVARGTLTAEERKVINDHIVVTIRMLESLPLPRHLRRVPEYAGGHHERMDGAGYPRGLTREQMSIPARIMAIADVFEALTAADRPYKPAKRLSDVFAIMSGMAANEHIDAALYDLFLTAGVWRRYAAEYLRPEQLDIDDIERWRPPAGG